MQQRQSTMRKRATRSLRELYGVTEMITEPEITPVLEGNYRIQGPVNESDHALLSTNSGKCPYGEKFKVVNESLPMRVDTGTCHVCSASCSSCWHNSRKMSVRESKMECGSSGYPCTGREADRHVLAEDDVMTIYSSRMCDDSQHAGSVASNLLSSNSSHDLYAENAESKVMLSTPEKYEVAEDIELRSFVPPSDTAECCLPEIRELIGDGLFRANKTSCMGYRTSPSQDEEHRGSECNRDNISCVTGTGDPYTEIGHHEVGLEKKIASSSSASTNTLLAKERENTTHIGAAEVFHCNVSKENQNNCKKQITNPNKSKNADCAGTMFSDNSKLNVHLQNDSPKIQSPCSRSKSGYVACCGADFKDSEGSTSSQFSMDRESSLGPEPIGTSSILRNTSSSTNENCEANHIRNEFSLDVVENTHPCLKTQNFKNGISSIEVTKFSCIKEKIVVSNSLTEASELQHQQVMGSGSFESDELTDVNVCDVCGDAGREYLLVICSRCSDGAEHTYCMRGRQHKVPDGYWLCEECRIMEDAERKKIVRECSLNEDTEVKVDKPEKVFGTEREWKLEENVEVNVEISGKVSRTAKVCKPKEDTELKEVDRSENVYVASKDCRSKEDIKHKQVDKTEVASATPKFSSREATLNFATTSNSKFISKLDTKAIDAGVRRVPKGQQSPRTSTKSFAENEEVKLVNRKRPRGISGDSILVSPRKRTALSRENSLKNMDMKKARVITIFPPNGVQSVNKYRSLSRSQSALGSHPTRVQDQLQPPSGSLQRSSSFSNLNLKPKVKQLAESVPVKLRMIRKSSVSGTRKEAITRLMTKSTSFKSISSVRPFTESESKTQFVYQSRTKNARYLKQLKERNASEMKISSMLDHPTVSLSPRTGSVFPLAKVNREAAPRDCKSNDLSKPNASKTNKESDDTKGLGRTDAKKLPTHASKIPGSASISLKSNNEDQRSCQSPKEGNRGIASSTEKSRNYSEIGQRALLHNSGSTHWDDKTKDTSILSSAQVVLGGNRILRCQKCNGIGHLIQSCSIHKLCSSALKPSAERKSRDVSKKSRKWKEAVKATVIKNRIHKNEMQNDLLQEVAVTSPNPSHDEPSKDVNSLDHPRDIPPVVGTSDDQGFLRETYVDSVEVAQVAGVGLQADRVYEASSTSRAVQPTEALSSLQGRDFSNTSTPIHELNMKSLFYVFPDKPSVFENPDRTAAIPKLKFIWQGCLEVLSSGNGPTLFDGIQAHLPTSASSEVLDVATKLPSRVQLEKVPCRILCPLQFQGICPDEYNIALFFFAKDVESYKRSYSKLLEEMLKHDSALRGTIDGVELVIFLSNKLPLHCQRWNGLLFLWGMFKGRRKGSSSSEPSYVKKHSGPIMDVNPSVQDLPCALRSVVSDFHDTVAIENRNNESPSYAGPTKAKALNPTVVLETPAISSSKVEDKMCKVQDSSLIRNFSFHSTADNTVPQEQISYLFPASQSFSGMNQPSDKADTHPELSFFMADIQSCSNVKSDEAYTKNLSQQFGGRYGVASSAHVPATCEQFGRRASPSFSISSDHKGTDCTGSCNELGKKMITANEARVNLTGTEQLNCESRLDSKRGHSCSTEIVSKASEETVKNSGDIMLCEDKVNYLSLYLPINDGRELKISDSFKEEISEARSASKLQPLGTSFLNEKQHRESIGCASIESFVPDARGHVERLFFPIEPSLKLSTKSDNVIHMLSSDDEDTRESNPLDLELALGGKRKTQERPQQKLLEDNNDDGDVPVSLSLSLAIRPHERSRQQSLF